MKKAFIFLVSLILCTHFSIAETGSGNEAKSAESMLTDFIKTQSVSSFRTALSLALNDPKLEKDRTAQLDTLCKIFAAGIKLLDPKFDERAPVFMNVTPPPGSGVDAGADPAAIKDPALRAQYEKAILANSEAIKYRNLQLEIRSEIKSLTPVVQGIAQKIDKKAALEIVKKYSTNNQIREMLSVIVFGIAVN
jgi:hypothetical protein